VKNMLSVLYGNLHFRKKADFIILPLKVLYIIYSIPFLLFSFLLMVRSFGAFGSPENEKIGIIKKTLLHIADLFLSYCLWISIFNILIDKS